MEYDYLYIYSDRRKIVKILQYLFKSKTGKDLLFCKKKDNDLFKYVSGLKEKEKNPYLFKIAKHELTSIKDYIEIEPQNKEIKLTSISVKAMSGNGKSIPPPPPPPPPPPIINSKNINSFSEPINLSAELEANKNNLIHEEVKDYESPISKQNAPVQNSMMAAIIAKRNQI